MDPVRQTRHAVPWAAGEERSAGEAAPAREVEPPSGKRLRHLDPGPLSDEPEMESHTHVMQLVVFLTSLLYAWRGRSDFFATGNMSIYYPVMEPGSDRTVRRKLRFRGPDFFVVLDPWPKPERNSWVVENEGGKFPDVIVEVLSRRTRSADRGKKKEIYERIFRTPEYFLFDPLKSTLEGYRLVRGRYKPIAPDAFGHLPSARLGFSLGLMESPELGGRKMTRLFTPKGEPVALPPEVADKEAARADQAERNTKREAERAAREAERAAREAERAAREAERAAKEAARADQAERDKKREAERAEREAARADQAEQEKKREADRAAREAARADQAEREKASLLAKLRAAGLDPEAPSKPRRRG